MPDDFDVNEIADQMAAEGGVVQQMLQEEAEQPQELAQEPTKAIAQARRVEPVAPAHISEKIVMEGGVMRVSNMAQAYYIATIFYQSGAFQARSVPNIQSAWAIIQTGMELDLSPLQSMRNIAVIEGNVALYGDLPLALCRRKIPGFRIEEGYRGEVEFSDEPSLNDFPNDYAAFCRVSRDHGETWSESEYSVADAKLAGLWNRRSNNGKLMPWSSNPRRQMRFRARGMNLRDTCGDVLLGMYGEGELDELLFEKERETFDAGTLRDKPKPTSRVDELRDRLSSAGGQPGGEPVGSGQFGASTDSVEAYAKQDAGDNENHPTVDVTT